MMNDAIRLNHARCELVGRATAHRLTPLPPRQSSVAISEAGSGVNALKLFGAAGKYGMASVRAGLGRTVALGCRSSASRQILMNGK